MKDSFNEEAEIKKSLVRKIKFNVISVHDITFHEGTRCVSVYFFGVICLYKRVSKIFEQIPLNPA